MMTPALRRFTFTTHITSSVGWVGAAMAFLALAVIGFTSDDPVKVRGAYLLMAPAAWFVLVPLAHASLLSGIVLSLGTTWGLFRYYWVVLKLGITVFATVILLIYMGTFRQMAGVAADPSRRSGGCAKRVADRSRHPGVSPFGRCNGAGRLQAIRNDRLRRAQVARTAASGLGAHTRKRWDSACTRRWQYTGLDLRGWRRRACSRAARRHPAPDRRHSDTPLGSSGLSFRPRHLPRKAWRRGARVLSMSIESDCCETSDRVPRQAACPVTGTTGPQVPLQTVKAILTAESLRRLVPTTYYFCPEPACAVVYFSQQGERYSKGDLAPPVWQKEPAGSRLLCYCFGESEETIAAEIAATGKIERLGPCQRTRPLRQVRVRHSESTRNLLPR